MAEETKKQKTETESQDEYVSRTHIPKIPEQGDPPEKDETATISPTEKIKASASGHVEKTYVQQYDTETPAYSGKDDFPPQTQIPIYVNPPKLFNTKKQRKNDKYGKKVEMPEERTRLESPVDMQYPNKGIDIQQPTPKTKKVKDKTQDLSKDPDTDSSAVKPEKKPSVPTDDEIYEQNKQKLKKQIAGENYYAQRAKSALTILPGLIGSGISAANITAGASVGFLKAIVSGKPINSASRALMVISEGVEKGGELLKKMDLKHSLFKDPKTGNRKLFGGEIEGVLGLREKENFAIDLSDMIIQSDKILNGILNPVDEMGKPLKDGFGKEIHKDPTQMDKEDNRRYLAFLRVKYGDEHLDLKNKKWNNDRSVKAGGVDKMTYSDTMKLDFFDTMEKSIKSKQKLLFDISKDELADAVKLEMAEFEKLNGIKFDLDYFTEGISLDESYARLEKLSEALNKYDAEAEKLAIDWEGKGQAAPVEEHAKIRASRHMNALVGDIKQAIGYKKKEYTYRSKNLIDTHLLKGVSIDRLQKSKEDFDAYDARYRNIGGVGFDNLYLQAKSERDTPIGRVTYKIYKEHKEMHDILYRKHHADEIIGNKKRLLGEMDEASRDIGLKTLDNGLVFMTNFENKESIGKFWYMYLMLDGVRGEKEIGGNTGEYGQTYPLLTENGEYTGFLGIIGGGQRSFSSRLNEYTTALINSDEYNSDIRVRKTVDVLQNYTALEKMFSLENSMYTRIKNDPLMSAEKKLKLIHANKEATASWRGLVSPDLARENIIAIQGYISQRKAKIKECEKRIRLGDKTGEAEDLKKKLLRLNEIDRFTLHNQIVGRMMWIALSKITHTNNFVDMMARVKNSGSNILKAGSDALVNPSLAEADDSLVLEDVLRANNNKIQDSFGYLVGILDPILREKIDLEKIGPEDYERILNNIDLMFEIDDETPTKGPTKSEIDRNIDRNKDGVGPVVENIMDANKSKFKRTIGYLDHVLDYDENDGKGVFKNDDTAIQNAFKVAGLVKVGDDEKGVYKKFVERLMYIVYKEYNPGEKDRELVLKKAIEDWNKGALVGSIKPPVEINKRSYKRIMRNA